MSISSPGVCIRQLCSLSLQLCSAQVLCQLVLSKGSALTGAQGPGYSIPFLFGFLLFFSLVWFPSPVHLVGSTRLFITLFLLFSPRRCEMDPTCQSAFHLGS